MFATSLSLKSNCLYKVQIDLDPVQMFEGEAKHMETFKFCGEEGSNHDFHCQKSFALIRLLIFTVSLRVEIENGVFHL